MSPKIAITMGDPAGVGPEIITRCLHGRFFSEACGIVVIGPREVILAEKGLPNLESLDVHLDLEDGQIGLLDIGTPGDSAIVPGSPDRNTSRLAGLAVERAADLALEGKVDAIVTAPLTKAAFSNKRTGPSGHTEYLASRAGIDNFAMLFVLEETRVLLATTHIALANVPEKITRDRIVACVRLLEGSLRGDFGIERPRIGVAGLNPHAGEGGLVGSEEEAIIRPAVDECQHPGLEISGPVPADTLFWRMTRGEFDGVVAMYHDQALIPVKMLGFHKAVNVTLGLPFIRTSVSHGTGFDIAGRGEADETSLVEALELAERLVLRREAAE